MPAEVDIRVIVTRAHVDGNRELAAGRREAARRGPAQERVDAQSRPSGGGFIWWALTDRSLLRVRYRMPRLLWSVKMGSCWSESLEESR
jgi:hypothetical protein